MNLRLSKIIIVLVLCIILSLGSYQIYLDSTHHTQRTTIPYFVSKTDVANLDLPPPQQFMQTFIDHDIVHIPNFLNEYLFNEIVKECQTLTNSTNRTHSSLALFRKGESVGAKVMDDHHQYLLSTLTLYYHPQLIQFLSQMFSCPSLTITPLDDLSRYTLLYYNQAKDGITWHVDGSHYFGRRFTIIFVLENKGDIAGKSCAKFEFKDKKDGSIKSIETAPNDFIAFDSNTLLHRATEMCEGDSRLLLSFTYINDTRRSAPGMLVNFVKTNVMKFY